MGYLPYDPIAEAVAAALSALNDGRLPSRIETKRVDFKEERGRRDRNGNVLAGQTRNEEAADHLAGELACLANTLGGGAIILGVSNTGERIGTALDAEWLRHRIWELTGHALTVSIGEVRLDGVRLLVLSTHQALAPVRYRGRLQWRIADNCVEVDATLWHQEARRRAGYDWSADRSGHGVGEASAIAVEIARRYLRAAGDDAANDLASAPTPDFLRRLNLVAADDRLTNAGALLFVATPEVGIDYIRRDVPGGDRTTRVRGKGPLLEQLNYVDEASALANRIVGRTNQGFAEGQIHAIPSRALREAVVNGVVHRDWRSPQPTTVEHIGDQLTVSSPGGFVDGIEPSNIITHPSAPRYRSLAEAIAALRLAEREGVGVDRMVRDMLALGHRAPEITVVDGPYVRVSLVGGVPDAAVLGLFAALEPRSAANDVDVVLLLTRLLHTGWVDVRVAQPILQRGRAETEAAIARLEEARVDKGPVIVKVSRIPRGEPTAWRLSDAMRDRLAASHRPLANADEREAMLLNWARQRGRLSTSEASDLARVSVVYAGELLRGLEDRQLLAPGRANRGGRGFFYVPMER
jgi:ATP-dependent DNA helicase RecG